MTGIQVRSPAKAFIAAELLSRFPGPVGGGSVYAIV